MEEPLREDIEESDDELEESPPASWVGPHKKVLFSALDYTVGDWAEQAITGELDLQPQYQRRHRWSHERKSRLIESLLMNVPLPPIFLSEEPGGVYTVIDGKQRITAITDYLKRKMPLKGLSYLTDLESKQFGDLPEEERRYLRRRIRLRGVIILENSPPEIRLETFHRLNTGGVKLNAQEIRNIAFRGPMNDLIMEISASAQFHRLLRIRDAESSRIHQEMRDAELVLRYLAFRSDWRSFDGSIKGHMDTFMELHREAGDDQLKSMADEFYRVVELVQEAYGDRAFARWQPERSRWRTQVVAALFDAQMLGIQKYSLDDVRGRSDQILAEQQKLFRFKRFREATEAATNARKAFEYRINAVERAIGRAL